MQTIAVCQDPLIQCNWVNTSSWLAARHIHWNCESATGRRDEEKSKYHLHTTSQFRWREKRKMPQFRKRKPYSDNKNVVKTLNVIF